MKLTSTFVGFSLLLLGLCNNALAADALSIMQSAHDAKRVDDQIATLTFRFIKPGQSEKQAIYIMVWKKMPDNDDYDNKAIFFTESPIEKKGIAYLGWLRAAGSDKLDDEWIYLPELRMTRRIVQRDHDHSHDDDEFGNSLLTRDHLEPRSPQLDDHEIIDEQDFNGQPHYLISSTPKHKQPMQDHGDHMKMKMASIKRINWVSKENTRLNRIQFINEHGVEQLDMKIQWTEHQGYWIWKSIEAIKPNTQAKTLLEFSDVKINSKLKDRSFHKRNLDKGSNRFK